ncbi:aldose epimerase family protein [Mucilaginibacter auburnensis]|uniref:Aldose 1-epimerase n=1 Tax=Mucilaginibacter auburnensis TaxID=1457233 RepID=A0A2H9VU03_9SPHI|nr:aldose epimerase family protein [Mucilaginibacter auburnensis]PJJ84307.1 aldose 1-epimerase [Mucilaginibacter auburnensis]
MRTKSKLFMSALIAAAAIGNFACTPPAENKSTEENTMEQTSTAIPDSSNFSGEVNGKATHLFTLVNKNGMQVAITNYGGRIVSLLVKDKTGAFKDVVLGYDNVKTYQKRGEPYFGALIGRYGNRIGKAKFSLNGKEYNLEKNDGANSLHGGAHGYWMQVWDAKLINKTTLELTYLSKDGEAGYPGNLNVKVVYTLTDNDEVKIDYSATTDQATPVNLTNHAYFNLNGAGDSTILNNELRIAADNITPVDNTLIPTGKITPVKGTAFDFTSFKAIGKEIGNADDEQLKFGKGYDHNFVLNKHTLKDAIATVKSPVTGIVMDVYTEEPAIQFYSGNFLDGRSKDGKGGVAYPLRSALCLETQHYPDSPNKPEFPSTTLNPGKTYKTTTIYKFSVAK